MLVNIPWISMDCLGFGSVFLKPNDFYKVSKFGEQICQDVWLNLVFGAIVVFFCHFYLFSKKKKKKKTILESNIVVAMLKQKVTVI